MARIARPVRGVRLFPTVAAALALASTLAVGGGSAHAQANPPVDQKAIDQAITKSADYLLAHVADNPGPGFLKSDPLLLLALTYGGKEKEKAVEELIKKVVTYNLNKPGDPYPVYNVALRAMALEKLDARKYQQEIGQSAWWLVNAQTDNGQWDYHGPKTAVPYQLPTLNKRPDNYFGRPLAAVKTFLETKRVEPWATFSSGTDEPGKVYRNTSTMQYGVLGLYAALRSNVIVPEETLKRAETVILDSQNVDGGWGYTTATDEKNSWGKQNQSTDTMTAGNLAALGVIQAYLPTKDGPRITKALEAGFKYLGQQMYITKERKRPTPVFLDVPLGGIYYYYALYSMERAGIICARARFGDDDWYAIGAKALLELQSADGSWGDQVKDGKAPYDDRLLSTAFGLLFLKRATPPIEITQGPDIKPAKK
ncbi:MAG: hypothetical protein HY719_06830 [Planctomycetes bacterium]|nr:hypothetical protein [Planctomycetota bacterium]